MFSLLNIGSLVLGLIAWILPLIHLLGDHRRTALKWGILSLSACAVSLCLQLFYTYHLVSIEDWSALMDTTGAVASVAAVLLIVTLLLNAMSLMVSKKSAAN
ncbi:hypothetical protein [Halobacillus karajensis]|uniref:Cytochrome c oxidase subunit 4 n=1 Tax=Halobacillus karajensis TaxID=195088 RepID=A0A024PA26_9BACI|nr:hypothetical protein [Halobacillus karajensis]CDQ20090.1 hypothetical protein BN982_02405 [Halobacillus karajensis]CDQ25247.1 hypothetical protein BN983_03560 [Halobacillus karajensis]CDQ28392.1 hypothetical protein BN981_02692 [Halobacillus karajensis]